MKTRLAGLILCFMCLPAGLAALAADPATTNSENTTPERCGSMVKFLLDGKLQWEKPVADLRDWDRFTQLKFVARGWDGEFGNTITAFLGEDENATRVLLTGCGGQFDRFEVGTPRLNKYQLVTKNDDALKLITLRGNAVIREMKRVHTIEIQTSNEFVAPPRQSKAKNPEAQQGKGSGQGQGGKRSNNSGVD